MRASGITLEIKMMRNYETQSLVHLYPRKHCAPGALNKLLLSQAFTGEL